MSRGLSMSEPKVIYLKDYQVPVFVIDHTQLQFELMTDYTLVTATLAMRRNPLSEDKNAALFLHGHADLELLKIRVDGLELATQSYQIDDQGLSVSDLKSNLTLEIVTKIYPDARNQSKIGRAS